MNTNTNKKPVDSVEVTPVPAYDRVKVLGVTVSTVTGTRRRNLVCGRLILTEEPGYGIGDGREVRMVAESKRPDGKNRILWSVDKAEKVSLWVRLSNGKMSFADGFELRNVHVSHDKDNAGVTTVFVAKDSPCVDVIAEIVDCASKMCDANPDACGYWEILDAESRRVFIRTYVPCTKDGTAVGPDKVSVDSDNAEDFEDDEYNG